ncbi:hypothetical protein [Tepidibacter thalassicus]|uniref:Uncharacterized protein n=1 Tax=Tepidibacter thalassicus DSM 15285 TaxID=1123350 RepID=A0A1M5TUX8_9FIRM|nr:hypothetical protein [Tepidibacter thalassicus]SHH54509.1 hypothetical protein SAMN02744040_02307 [Tepidibacter thalassicus DSM 15285]
MKKQIKFILIIFFISILISISMTLKQYNLSSNNKTLLQKEEEKQDLREKSDFNLEMEVYKLNKKNTLSDNEVELLINYLGKIDWAKYHEIEKQQDDIGEFDITALLKYDKYTSKEILYIYEACIHNDGVTSDAFFSLLYDLSEKYPHESAKLYKQHQGYKELLDIIIENYKYNENLDA